MTTLDAPICRAAPHLFLLPPQLHRRVNTLTRHHKQRAMSSSRTAAVLSNLHNPRTTGLPSFCLYSCSARSFSDHHGISRKRPTRPRPRPRHSPVIRHTMNSFSTSTQRFREPNHYEVLDLPVTATAGEIKKCANPPPQPLPQHNHT